MRGEKWLNLVDLGREKFSVRLMWGEVGLMRG